MKIRKVLLAIVLVSICMVTAGFSQGRGTFIDGRDNKTYKWVQIGTQVWMAENLAYTKCFQRGATGTCPNNGVYDKKLNEYDAYYDWAIVMDLVEGHWKKDDYHGDWTKYPAPDSLFEYPHHQGIAPDGWHIPTQEEYKTLLSHLGGGSTAGQKLHDKDGFDITIGGYVIVG